MAHDRNIRITALFAGVMLLSALCSCTWEKEFGGRRQPGDGNALVRFSVKVPGATLYGTRALSGADENEVREIDILVFEPDGGEYVYTAKCTGDQITTDPSNIMKKSFTAMLREGEYDMAILANSREAIGAADLDGKNKEAALAALTIMVEPGRKWIADPAAEGYKPFPMWGDVGNITIAPDTELTGDDAISLIRALACVDVQVDAAVDRFKLTSVEVHNYQPEGAIVPAPTAWNAAENIVTAPTEPSPSTRSENEIIYDNGDGKSEIDEDGNSCVDEIYLFEYDKSYQSENHDVAYRRARCFLVIGGIFDTNGNGDFGDDGAQTYYRLDFSTGKGDAQTFLDLLRNHRYVFNITKVMGPGYSTSADARYSEPVNIESNVILIDDPRMKYFVYDGQNVLAINEINYDLNYSMRSPQLMILTDAYVGWVTEKVVDAADGITPVTWLRPSPNMGYENSYTGGSIFIDENEIFSDRKAIIWIVSGRMRIPITVSQSWSSLWGGGADILYFDTEDGNRLSIGKWDERPLNIPDITFDNMVFTQFGSIIGFTGGGAWDNTNSIMFNPTNTPSFAYDAIPNYGTEPTAWAGSTASSPSVSDTERYHTFANIKAGRGDICRLAGLTAEDIRGASSEAELNALLEDRDPKYKGWRLPTARESLNFVGADPEFDRFSEWDVEDPYYFYYNDTGIPRLYLVWRYYYSSSGGWTNERGSNATPATGRFPVVTSYFDAYTQILPLPGKRDNDASYNNDTQGADAGYWTSTPSLSDCGFMLGIDDEVLTPADPTKPYIYGASIRCVRESR